MSPKTALVISGGGSKGAFAIGALEYILEFRQPTFDSWSVLAPGSTQINEGDSEKVRQAEAGVKMSTDKLGLFASVFYSRLDNVVFNDEVLDSGGNLVPRNGEANTETPGAELGFFVRARQIELRLADIQKLLSGDRTRSRYSEFTVPSVLSRIYDVVGARNNWSTTYGPTDTHRQSYEIAARDFEEVRPALRALIDTDLSQLEADLEAAGAPWTPGRRIPDLNL